ncbi:hypothetical protein ACVIW0_001511 [Bradyrhizobium sp. USDA 4454]
MTHVTIDCYGSLARHPSQCWICARFSVHTARFVVSNISNRGFVPEALADAGFVDGAADLPGDDIAADYALLHEQLRRHDQYLAAQTRLVGPTQSHLLAARMTFRKPQRGLSTTRMATTQQAFVSVIERQRSSVFSPGICWSGLNLNRSGWEVQHLQMYS